MAIKRFLNQTGMLKNRTGYDQYGKEVQTAGTSINCRFQESNKTHLMPDGSVEAIHAIVFFDPTVNANSGDHFVFEGVDYRILDIQDEVDGLGNLHHLEARLVRWTS